MLPIGFPESTHSLTPNSQGHGDHDVRNLPVWTDGEQCVSCWKMSARERLSALIFGKVWLASLSGRTQHPAALMATRRFFSKLTQGEPECSA